MESRKYDKAVQAYRDRMSAKEYERYTPRGKPPRRKSTLKLLKIIDTSVLFLIGVIRMVFFLLLGGFAVLFVLFALVILWPSSSQKYNRNDTGQLTETSVTTGCPGGCTQYPDWCAPPIKGNVSYDSREKIYHLPEQEYYDATKISPQYGERWFCTETEALQAGWRKAYPAKKSSPPPVKMSSSEVYRSCLAAEKEDGEDYDCEGAADDVAREQESRYDDNYYPYDDYNYPDVSPDDFMEYNAFDPRQ